MNPAITEAAYHEGHRERADEDFVALCRGMIEGHGLLTVLNTIRRCCEQAGDAGDEKAERWARRIFQFTNGEGNA